MDKVYRVKNGAVQSADVVERLRNGWLVLSVGGEQVKSKADRWHESEEAAKNAAGA